MFEGSRDDQQLPVQNLILHPVQNVFGDMIALVRRLGPAFSSNELPTRQKYLENDHFHIVNSTGKPTLAILKFGHSILQFVADSSSPFR